MSFSITSLSLSCLPKVMVWSGFYNHHTEHTERMATTDHLPLLCWTSSTNPHCWWSWQIVSQIEENQDTAPKKYLQMVINVWMEQAIEMLWLSTVSAVHKNWRGSTAGLFDQHRINTRQAEAEGAQSCLVWLGFGTYLLPFTTLKHLHMFAKSASFPYQTWNSPSIWNTHFHLPPSAKRWKLHCD